MPVITGTEGDDGLYDTSGDDIINALGGNDEVDIINGGTDTVDGGTGRDIMHFRFQFIPGDRGAFTLNTTQNGGSVNGSGSWAGGLTSFSNFEDIWVTSLFGNYNDSITTGAGDDIVEGGGGTDVVNLGAGMDKLVYSFSTAATMSISSTDANGNNGVVNGTQQLTFTGIDIFQLTGSTQNDILLGAQLADILKGANGNDELRGGGGNDSIEGGNGNDLIFGDDGDDSLLGGANDDEIHGGNNNDTINGGTGVDTIYGDDGNDSIDGGTGADNIFGGEGDDIIFNTSGGTVDGGTGADQITAGSGTVSGGTGNDKISVTGTGTLDGGEGDDELTFQAVQSRTISGGAGRDLLVLNMVNNFGNLEQTSFSADPSGGYQGSFTVTMVPDSRIITFSGIEDFKVIGNGFDTTIQTGDGNDIFAMGAGADTVYAGGGDDSIDGSTGADTMVGGTGNDLYWVEDPFSVGDTVIEYAGEGIDTIFSSLFVYTLPANVENLTSIAIPGGVRYTGNELDNGIVGSKLNDTLIGLGGRDTLYGLAGNDSYVLDSPDDVVVEAAGEGNDTVYATTDYRLSAGSSVETLTPYERELTDPLRLTGNELANTIYGNAGNNVLTGLGGADMMYGLAGDDAYLVDTLDQVFEQSGQGYDTVYSEGDFALNNASFVEAMSVYDRDTTNALTLFGNNLDNVIYGNQGSNALLGGGGEDTLYGLGGDDRYFVDSFGDQVVEAAGGGNDTIYTTLGSYQLITDQSVETLTVYDRDTTYVANLTGNNLAQFIYGNAGANDIDGKGGADTLYGMAGADTFTFTNAPLAGAADALADFSAADDTIALDDVAFLGIGGPGPLNANAFVVGSQAADADDRIVYNQATGQIFFDADGNGDGAQVLFATVNSGTVLSALDFTVI